MNLVMASVLLLAMLAFQPTLIYGSKNLASSGRSNGNTAASNIGSTSSGRKVKSSKYGKRHAAAAEFHPLYSPALSATSKLVLSMDTGDVLVRAARGAAVDKETPSVVVQTTNNNGSGGGGGKRQKNNGNSNKKLNRNQSTHESGTATSSASAGRKHAEKKFSASSGGLGSAQQTQHSNNNNNKGKQRQMLKSQNHQGKRSGNNGGNKAIRENGDMLEGASGKPSTCRYAKSAWTECDPKTNMRSRTLNLKKGDASCQLTRTMQKKCKKSCRYEKGAWSECINGQMAREDKLKATGGSESSSSSCEATRSINKKCNPNNNGGASKQGGSGNGKKERKNKEKGSRRNQGQQHQEQQQHQ